MTPQDARRYTRLLDRSDLFCDFDEQLLTDVDLGLQGSKHPKNATVLDPLARDERFSVILSGRVSMSSVDIQSGRELTTFLLGPGDVFDIVALLDDDHPLQKAVAIDAVELLHAPMDNIRKWIRRNPNFNVKFLPYLGKMMGQLIDLSGDLVLHDVGVRLARLIVRNIDPKLPSPQLRLINDLSHRQLAELIGTVRVVVSRQLRNLRASGLVSTERGNLIVNDLEALRDIAKGVQ